MTNTKKQSLTSIINDSMKTAVKSIKNTGLGLALGMSALVFPGCDVPFGKYDGKSMKEVIKMVSDPKEAQDFIDQEISYKRNDGVAAFSLTFERKNGECEAGAIACAAMLADNGYPALVLGAYPKKGEGHAVFIYEDNGKWGSAGINKSDYRPSKFESPKKIAQKIAEKFDYDWQSYVIYDFSLADLVNGASKDNRHLPLEPFVVYSEDVKGDIRTILNANMTKITDGFIKRYSSQTKKSSVILMEAIGENVYDGDFNLVSDQRDQLDYNGKDQVGKDQIRVKSRRIYDQNHPKDNLVNENSIDTYVNGIFNKSSSFVVLERYSNKNVKTSVSTFADSKLDFCEKVENEYDLMQRVKRSLIERNNIQEPKQPNKRLIEREFLNEVDNLTSIERTSLDRDADGIWDSFYVIKKGYDENKKLNQFFSMSDYDANGFWDFIVLDVLSPDGKSWTHYYDFNADGTWDEIKVVK